MLVFIFTLSGCSVSKDENNADAIDYFVPVINELKLSSGEMIPIMDAWWDEGVPYSEEYSNKIYTCHIGENTFTFDLAEELGNNGIGRQREFFTMKQKIGYIYVCTIITFCMRITEYRSRNY